MIRVLLIPSSDYLGHPFPQRHNQIFERLHDGKNFEVHVLRYNLYDKPKLESKLVIHEVDDFGIKPIAPYYLFNARRHAVEMRNIIRRESIDAIVLSNLAAPFAYMILDTFSSMHKPVIFDLPDYYPTSATGYLFNVRSVVGNTFSGFFDSILRHMMRRASIVTAASHALAGYAERSGARRVAVVSNGIAECFLELHNGKGLREKFGYDEHDIVAGYIGSLEFWLDMQSFIKGVALARKRGMSAKLLIVGSKLQTNYFGKVVQWIKQENLEKHTDFLDFVPHEDVPVHISAIDAGAIPFDLYNPTAYYAAPNKMWEYLSQKRPVICTPIPEALSNFDCLLTALTPEDYAEHLVQVASRKEEITQKVETGYKRALNRTWKDSARVFASIVESLVRA